VRPRVEEIAQEPTRGGDRLTGVAAQAALDRQHALEADVRERGDERLEGHVAGSR
jgi:hypothetical protein